MRPRFSLLFLNFGVLSRWNTSAGSVSTSSPFKWGGRRAKGLSGSLSTSVSSRKRSFVRCGGSPPNAALLVPANSLLSSVRYRL
uniref:Putative secreted protein n=1 Tax=Anopheles marajoara TaxID=58244 RepID=A0A2M4CB47_9DIPT